jgi:hypothetical protein
MESPQEIVPAPATRTSTFAVVPTWPIGPILMLWSWAHAAFESCAAVEPAVLIVLDELSVPVDPGPRAQSDCGDEETFSKPSTLSTVLSARPSVARSSSGLSPPLQASAASAGKTSRRTSGFLE